MTPKPNSQSLRGGISSLPPGTTLALPNALSHC